MAVLFAFMPSAKRSPDPHGSSYHDWTSHHADWYRYVAVGEDQMTNAAPMPAPTLAW